VLVEHDLDGGAPVARGIRPLPRRGDAVRKPGVVRAQPVELDAVDRENAARRRGAHACGPFPVDRQQCAFPDAGAGAELANALGRLDPDVAFEDHVETGAVLAVLDQHLTGRDLGLRSDRLEQL
jgi:hypothetical protein